MQLPGRYQLLRELGSGGEGSVYHARDLLEEREVAIKVFPRETLESGVEGPNRLARAEFRLLASQSHPNIVRVYDFGTLEDGRCFFSMELLEGPDFLEFARSLVRERSGKAIPIENHAVFEEVLCQVLGALDVLHRRGILYLDLKPANVRVTRARAESGRNAGPPTARLIDFGLARTREAPETEVGGTAEYLAPERIRGEAADARCDLYSLGVILYEILVGECPFRGESAGEVIRQHLESPVPHPERLPERYRQTVLRLLEKQPSRRPPSAWEVRLELFGEPWSPAEAWPPFEVAFVGREGVLRRIEGALRSAATGKGPRALLLRGERGAGKTRLLREIELRLQLEGGLRGCGAGVESCSGRLERPGELLCRLLRRAAICKDVRSRGPSVELTAKADSERPPREEATDRWIHEIEDLARSTDAEGPSSDAELEGRRDRILDGFARGILAMAGRPLVLLVDNFEAADTLSREGVLTLLRAMEYREDAQLTLLLACRDGEPAEIRRLQELEQATRGLSCVESLPLGRLESAEVDSYLRQVLGPGSYPPELVATLEAQTGGNIFFIEEYLKLLIHSGVVRREGAAWRVVSEATGKLPATVEEALSRRLESVGESARELLEWASLMERPFTLEEIEELLSRDGREVPVDIEASLGALRIEQLIEPKQRGYTLPSEALRTVLRDSLPESTARRRHGILARRLLETGLAEERLEEAAHHLFHSERPESARDYLLRAGERARRSGALAEAEVHLARALELGAETRTRCGILLSHQEVLGHLGRKDAQERDLAELRRLVDSLGDRGLQREATLREALYLESLGRKREALECLEGALEHQGSEPGDRAPLLSRIGMLRILLSEFPAAHEALEEASAFARRSSNSRLEAECRQLEGLGHYLQSDYDAALEEMNRALVIFRAEGERHRAAALESNIGLIHLDRGHLEAAEERFRAALELFHRIGLRRGEAVSLLNLGLVYSEMGRYERALDSITRSLSFRRQLGDRRAEGADLGNLAAVWVRVGCPERAVSILEQAIHLAREFDNRQSESANECRLGLVDLARGNPVGALDHLERGLELAGQSHLPAQEMLARSGLARSRLALGEPSLAQAEARAALALAEEARLEGQIPLQRALLATTLLEGGEPEAADAASRQAAEELDRRPGRLADAHEVWYARYRVLEALRSRSREEDAGETAGGPGEAECENALRKAYLLLREKADDFEDEALRQAFLENVPVNRDINHLHELLQARIRREASARERSFHEIAKSIHSIVELDPLLDRLLSLAIETTHAEKGLIALKNPDESFTTRAARGMATESVNDAAEICRSVIADVAKGGGPVLATDAASDTRFRERRSIISFHIRTLMCVPLVMRDEIVGAVYVDGRGASSFDSEDLDYLVSFSQLAAIAVENVRLLERLRAENLYLRREVETRYSFENMIGGSAPMQRLARLIEKVARTPASVLIWGETGTGKELVARAIHHASDRKSRPFVAVDCGALPENLLESELFGHKRGSFSGAVHDRVGLFEEAGGGTIFLDEVTNMSLDLQAKLLRVLQEGEIRRLGENTMRKVDVRVLAASNVDVRSAVDAGEFREDLFYRLNVVTAEVPPLRDRREDIPLLVSHFLEKSCRRLGKSIEGVTEDGMRFLVSAPWRGNVRELENCMEKAVILADADRLDAVFLASILPPSAHPPAEREAAPGKSVVVQAPGSTPTGSENAADLPTLGEFDTERLAAEKLYLERLVEAAGGNLAEAARRAGVKNRNTLISRLKKHGLGRKSKG